MKWTWKFLRMHPIQSLSILLDIEVGIDIRDTWVGLYWNREVFKITPEDVSWDLYFVVMTLLLHFRWIHAGAKGTKSLIRSLKLKRQTTLKRKWIK